VYVVGGCIRDLLLGRKCQDIDLASSALPGQVLAVFGPAAGIVQRTLGTVHIRWEGVEYEHTTFRRESYPPGGGHTPARVELGVTKEEDAFRRDFSINALYYDILADSLEDPTGKGIADLTARRIATTAQDPYAIIKDDGLRILRMVRFCVQLGFGPDRALFFSARENVGLLNDISAERISEELKKILLCDPLKGLLLLKALGALYILFPELKEGEHFPQNPKYHRFSVLMHSIMVCAHTPPDLSLRLAGLLHDVAKPMTMRQTGNMHRHEIKGAEMAGTMLSRLRFDNATIERVRILIRYHMYDLSGVARTSKIRRLVLTLGPGLFRDLIALRRADVWGSGIVKGNVASADRFETILNEMIDHKTPFLRKELAVTGGDLMCELGIKSGRTVGRILNELLLICADRPTQNTRARLLYHAKRIYNNGASHV